MLTILNKKGGVGKTSFSFSIAKDLGYYLQSNDASIIETIYPNMAKIVKDFKPLDKCVYDCGGFVAKGVLDIARDSNYVIIPCTPLYNSILRTIETINEVIEINKNIIILITGYNTNKEKEYAYNFIYEYFKDFGFKYFFFKNSKIIENSMKQGMSISELYNQNSLSKYTYAEFYKTYDELIQLIKG